MPVPKMMPMTTNTATSASMAALCWMICFAGCGQKWAEDASGDLRIVDNRGGKTLGYNSSSGVALLTVDRLAFKDLNRNGALEPYEDWRLPSGDRAKDLASRMSVEQIAGLMLYSSHQAVPASGGFFGRATYGGKPYADSGAKAWDLTDEQKRFLTEDRVRHVLITSAESPEVAARWNNNVQALAESMPFGIPVNTSSDPRHRARVEFEFLVGASRAVSIWPNAIGLAATFDPEIVRNFGDIASREYRALGIATALSPQIDLATDPRWSRFSGTFGGDPALATDMARRYVDGFQTSVGDAALEGSWGLDSVNAMAKHWPGGGSGEGGRDAHFSYGKYSVYPGGNFDLHLRPFTDGAFQLEGGTGQASAIMPNYTIPHRQDGGENVGSAFSRHVIANLLRERHGFDGVVCTDWGVTADYAGVDRFGASPWGVEGLTEGERHYRALVAGVDQFGGNNDAGPVLEAYRMGVAELGEAEMRLRFEQSAVRLLTNIFRVGLFENPYLDAERTKATVGHPDHMAAGYDAQVKSLVLVKNRGGVLPLAEGVRAYIPKRHLPAGRTFFGMVTPARVEDGLDAEIAAQSFAVATTPDDADAAVVVMESPMSGPGYDAADARAGGNGYLPRTLQFRPYTAVQARAESIAGGDPLEGFTNRSYRGKRSAASNVADLNSVLETRQKMPDKPLIVVLKAANPTVVSEFEASADAILVSFGVQEEAIFDVLTGRAEPSGLLPIQMPAYMRTVEEQAEDTPHDMRVHVDSEGNAYDFGFGLGWGGVIDDDRTKRYVGNPQIKE